MSQRLLQGPPTPRPAGGRLKAQPDAPDAGGSSNAASNLQAERSSAKAALELRRARAATESWDGLSRTLREMATDLANSRRECRQREDEIEALKTEIALLCVATGVPVRPDEQFGADNAREGRGDQLGARRTQHEHAIAWMSTAVLVLRRGTLALKEENASLRLELERLRASKQTRPTPCPAADRC
jgi:hypothetical protein